MPYMYTSIVHVAVCNHINFNDEARKNFVYARISGIEGWEEGESKLLPYSAVYFCIPNSL